MVLSIERIVNIRLKTAPRDYPKSERCIYIYTPSPDNETPDKEENLYNERPLFLIKSNLASGEKIPRTINFSKDAKTVDELYIERKNA